MSHIHPRARAMEIKSVTLTPISNYNPIVHRVYSSGVQQHTQNKFNEVTNFGRNLTVDSLAKVAPEIFVPSAEHSGQIDLAYGFAQRRYAVTIEVEALPAYAVQVPITYIVAGYTDHDDMLSLERRFIDPNMGITINSITEIANVPVATGEGVVYQRSVRHVNQVVPTNPAAPNVTLQNRLNPGYNGMDMATSPELLTPQAIFWKCNSADSQEYLDKANVIDNRTKVVGDARLVNRKNNDSVQYASEIFNTYNRVASTCDETDDWGEITRRCAGVQTGQLVAENLVIWSLRAINPNFNQNAKITWGTLQQIDPHLTAANNNKINLVQQDAQTTGAQYSRIEANSGNDGANTEDLIAARLFYSVPFIMSTLGFKRMNFSATNRTMNRQWDVLPVPNNCLTVLNNGGNIAAMVDKFIQQTVTMVLAPATMDGVLDIDINFFAGIEYDLRISISVCGGATKSYVFPMYCDATVNPCVSFDGGNALNTIAANVSFLLSEMTSINTATPTQMQMVQDNFNMQTQQQFSPNQGGILMPNGQPSQPQQPADNGNGGNIFGL